MPTYSPKASEITRAWHVIDADGLVLGRMCTEAARVLAASTSRPSPRTSTPATTCRHQRRQGRAHQGQGRQQGVPLQRLPGRPEVRAYEKLLGRKPEEAIRRSIQGMLPKGPSAAR